MYPHRSRMLPTAALLALVACEDTATDVPSGASELPSDLAFEVPIDLRDRLVVRTIKVDSVRPDGPARSEHLGYGSYPSDPSYGTGYEDVPAAGIWDANTRATFFPGRLSVVGSHEYVANKSSIDTRGSLAFQGTVIGTNQAYVEQSHPFLIPLLSPQFIWAEARIYTDRECDLSGWGDSAHAAWWEAVFGGPVFTFSRAQVASHADRAYQPACPSTPPPPSNTNTGTTSTGGGGEGVCYVWITYDIYTGEIYDQQLMFCTDGG
jgi:hypothetical protein